MKKIEMIVPDHCYTMIDCWDAIMIMLLTFYNKETDVVFAGSDFYYDFPDECNNEMTLSDIFNRSIGLYNFEMLLEKIQFYEDHIGLKLKIMEINTINIFREEIESEILSNRPVVIFLDTYKCKFNKMYQMFEFFHGAIICGIEDNQLLIQDPTQHLNLIKVDIEDVYRCMVSLVKLDSKNLKDEIDTISIFEYSFFKVNFDCTYRKGTKLESIHRFVNDLINNKNEVFQSMERSEESLSIMISWLFKNMALRYKYLPVFLKSHYEPQKIESFLAILGELHDKWRSSGRLFMKMYFFPMQSREEAFNKLDKLMNEILIKENELFNEFCELLQIETRQLEGV